jgi:hypothetical protein
MYGTSNCGSLFIHPEKGIYENVIVVLGGAGDTFETRQ